MKDSNKFDLIVIGAGSGGLNIAGAMNKLGFKVLLIDKKNKNIGGDCLNTGCVPSKALLHVARTINTGKKGVEFGQKVSGKIDIKKVLGYIKNKQDIIRKTENAIYLKKQGIEVVLGKAKFVSPDEVLVGKNKFFGTNIVIATGSRPRNLDVKGIEKTKVYTNEEIFDIKFLPKKLLVVGGGPIGFEIGQAFNYLGSKVTIINKDFSFLPKEDAEIRNALMEKMRSDGIVFLPNTEIDEIKSKKQVVLNKLGVKKKASFDAIFVAIGRYPNIDKLNLKKAGIKEDGNNIVINKYLQTTNPKVFVCGDVAGGYQFTHVAEKHAEIIIRNFFSFFKTPFEEDEVSWVTYTDPEIATFGLRTEMLSDRGIPYKVISEGFFDNERAIVGNYQNAKAKIFVGRDGRILGGSVVAPGAGELIQELILAQKHRIKLSKLFYKIYPYPTATRINKKLAGIALSGRLNFLTKSLLRFLYR